MGTVATGDSGIIANAIPSLIIAGVRGGSGKTTLSLSLITPFRALRGLKVVPFKKGPDYIDAGWMSLAAVSPCYNLDPFLIPNDKILQSFSRHSTGDIAVIEGNRGLYDGLDAAGSCSTAELGKLLKAPVILVLDCSKMTRTAAAVVLGWINMDKDVRIKGVVLKYMIKSCWDNFTGGEETVSLKDPLDKVEGDERVELIKRCERPCDKKCRCDIHREYFNDTLD